MAKPGQDEQHSRSEKICLKYLHPRQARPARTMPRRAGSVEENKGKGGRLKNSPVGVYVGS
jgi:hypothetical protein